MAERHPGFVGTSQESSFEGLAKDRGFTLTAVTIWLIPMALTAVTWRLAFLVLVAGPALGLVAMLRLMRLPEARSIALGRG